MLRDALVVAAIAVLTVQALRRYVADRYLVPTGSMEPVLHGDPRTGDVVLVRKLASAGAQRRGDLVVVDHPSQPGQRMVKRIAACGDEPEGCWIDILQGDLWLGPDPQRLRREQKDPLTARSQRVTWAVEPGTEASRDAIDFAGAERATPTAPLLLPAVPMTVAEARSLATAASRAARRARNGRPLPAGFLGSARPMDAGCIDATGARSTAGSDVPVTDVGMDVQFAAGFAGDAVAADILAAIETRHENLTFHWQPASGRVVLWRDGEDVASRTLPIRERTLRLEFGLLDDRVFFCVDGEPEALFLVARRPEWNGDAARVMLPVRSVVWIGALGGPRGPGLALASVRLFHDVHRWRDPIVGMPGQAGAWPQPVPPGHWFLLGDSAFDSHDSRQFGPVAMAAFVGVPWYVLGPWARRRWVTP